MNKKISAYKICVIAFAVVINYIGGQIALLLHLPIYLDSIGTFFTAALLGPIWGMLPNFLSGLILGFTIDVYSLYYAPVGILVGLITGLVCRKGMPKRFMIIPAAAIITLPTSLVSALITAKLFGGITSSGSTIIVQLLTKANVNLTLSCFIVQFLTDYVDRIISLILAAAVIKAIPASMKEEVTGRFYDKSKMNLAVGEK